MSLNYGGVIHRSSGREEAANVASAGNLGGVRIVLRVAIGFLIGLIVLIAAVPILVLRDLNSGGTGWGLCSEGLRSCTNSYFAGFELLALLFVALFLVLVALRAAVRTLRWVEHHEDRLRTVVPARPEAPGRPTRSPG